MAYSSALKMEAYLRLKCQALSKLGYVKILVQKSFPDMYIAVSGSSIQYVVTTGTLMENFNTFRLLSGTAAGQLRFHYTYHFFRRLKQ
jgi:hypothetical protein